MSDFTDVLAAAPFEYTDRLLDALVNEAVSRGFAAVQAELDAAAPTDKLTALLRYLRWDGHHLQAHYPAQPNATDGGQYLIQHLRERAHHEGNDALRDVCDRWLTSRHLPYFKSQDAWRYPNHPALIRTFNIDDHDVGGLEVAFSADGSRMLTAKMPSVMEPMIVQVWDTNTGVELRNWLENDDSVSAAALSTDGHLALLGANKVVELWDTQTGIELRRFEGHTSRIRTVAFSADGKWAASGAEDKKIYVWDLQTGLEKCSLSQGDRLSAVVLSADGSRLLSASYGVIRLWDTETKAELYYFDSYFNVGRGMNIGGIALSADGQRALWKISNGTIRVFDGDLTAEPRVFAGFSEKVSWLAASPDVGQVLSTASDGTIRLWDTQTGSELRHFGRADFVQKVVMSTDSQRLLKMQMIRKSIQIWDTRIEDTPPLQSGPSAYILSLALSADGQRILTGSNDKTMRLLEVQTGREIVNIDFSTLPDVIARPGQSRPANVNFVALSPDGSRALSSSGDNVIRLWDIDKAAELRRFMISGWQEAFSADSQWALATSKDYEMKFWNTQADGEPVTVTLHSHQAPIVDVALSADGSRALSGSVTISGAAARGEFEVVKDDTVRLWDTHNGVELNRFEGHSNDITCVALSADGTLPLSGSKDKTLRLWDINTGKELRRFEGHTGEIKAVAVSPDNKWVLSASTDRTVRLWDTQTGKTIALLYCDIVADNLAFAADNPSPIAVSTGSNLHVMTIEGLNSTE